MDGLLRHFQAVLQEGPAIIYNVPGRTGQDIPDHIVEQIAKDPNFLGVKECTGNDRIKVGISVALHVINDKRGQSADMADLRPKLKR